MNHQTITNTIIPCLRVCAWIAIIVLCCSIISTYWLPMLVGAIAISLLFRLAGQ
jgi:hypothetical protein